MEMVPEGDGTNTSKNWGKERLCTFAAAPANKHEAKGATHAESDLPNYNHQR